jgi:hypothetical protein
VHGDDGDYYEETRGLLERAYLTSEDPRGGSGSRGDGARWERARRPVVSAAIPPHRRREMVERSLREYLVSGGRLIVSSYGSSRRPVPRAEPVREVLRGWGYTLDGETEAADTNGVVITRVAWTSLPET